MQTVHFKRKTLSALKKKKKPVLAFLPRKSCVSKRADLDNDNRHPDGSDAISRLLRSANSTTTDITTATSTILL